MKLARHTIPGAKGSTVIQYSHIHECFEQWISTVLTLQRELQLASEAHAAYSWSARLARTKNECRQVATHIALFIRRHFWSAIVPGTVIIGYALYRIYGFLVTLAS